MQQSMQQLDIFADSRDVVLRNDVVEQLQRRHAVDARKTPHRFARQQVDVRYTNGTVEIFHRGTRIAAHARSTRRGHHTTIDAHMPPHHQDVSGWGAQRLYDWAVRIGPHTAAVIQHLLGGRQHPQQAFRACLGVLRLGKDHGNARLEAA